MRRIQAVALFLCVMVVAVTGCRGGGQIFQVKDAPVQTATGKQPSMEDVQKAIIAAGVGLGWQMAVAKPGEIIATLNIRSHQAVVSIPYTTKNYSILYKDSANLKYDAEKQTIHENYSSWIQRLDGAIRSRLTAAGM
ncbi:MAG TPA: hypothetical protein VD738_11030 [Nitrospira sp.]|jgi:hypothetical protein|nr:hypothetical protein [Nitrospira sp.]